MKRSWLCRLGLHAWRPRLYFDHDVLHSSAFENLVVQRCARRGCWPALRVRYTLEDVE